MSSAAERFVSAPSQTPVRVCPRCKQQSNIGSSRCSLCGFSFLETSILDKEVESKPPAGLQQYQPNDSRRSTLTSLDDCPEQLVGTIIDGRYRVLSVLGKGGFGVVYKVEFLLLDDPIHFALKVLHLELSYSDSFRRRFFREARLAMGLAHENVIQVRELGVTLDGLLYFTMDLIEGESLRDFLAREGALPQERALDIVRQILRVLVRCHEQGIVHRDLKPANIFLEPDSRGWSRVKVGDFGLAKSLSEKWPARGQDITQGGIVGSPRYMSPEQSTGAAIDGRSDLFSLGMILYELLYGGIPKERELEGAGGTLPSPPTDGQHRVSREVFEVVRRALANDREERFQSAQEFLDAIEGLDRVKRGGRGWALYSSARAILGGVLILLVAIGVYSTLFLQNPPSGNGGASLASGTADLSVAGEVSSYFPLEVGKTYPYRVFREGQEGPHDLLFQVLAEEGKGRFLVHGHPGNERFYWIFDYFKNTITQESIPQGQGERDQGQRRTVLKLPRDPSVPKGTFTNRVDGEESWSTVEPEPRPVTFHGYTFRGCLKVVDHFPGKQRTIVRYYQKRTGEVSYQEFDDSRNGRLVYSRVLITEEEAE